jgi:hypothetical protein
MIVAATVLAFVLLLPFLQETAWVGHASVPLEFLILDASMGRPINGD